MVLVATIPPFASSFNNINQVEPFNEQVKSFVVPSFAPPNGSPSQVCQDIIYIKAFSYVHMISLVICIENYSNSTIRAVFQFFYQYRAQATFKSSISNLISAKNIYVLA